MRAAACLLFFSLSLPAATLNVRKHGAKGDGSDNATSGIQSAFESCAPGDTVAFPKGIYATDTLRPPATGCTVTLAAGARVGDVIIIPRTAGMQSIIYGPSGANFANNTYRGLVFDLSNGKAGSAYKQDWQGMGLELLGNLFKGGGNPAAIFLPGGTGKGSRPTRINGNIFQDVHQGVLTPNKLFDTQIDGNRFERYYQAISAGGCSDTSVGSGVSISGNVFLGGIKMAGELCGRMDDVTIRNNYVAQQRAYPGKENYGNCPWAHAPYACDSVSFSLAIGGQNLVVEGNWIYQPRGVSWAFEYAARGPASRMANNDIRDSGLAAYDGGCSDCAVTRAKIAGNIACGGDTTRNPTWFAKWPRSNRYYASCADPALPPKAPVPPPPFEIARE
jgi:hypothetical protein